MNRSKLFVLKVVSLLFISPLYATIAKSSSTVQAQSTVLPKNYSREESRMLDKEYLNYYSQVFHEKSHDDHTPRFLHHGQKTKVSALVIPGSFESPAHFRTMTQYFYEEKGHNTLTVSLQGFWEKDLNKVTTVKFQQWLDHLDKTMQFLSRISDKTIIYGHSLGGLLSIYLAHKFPEQVQIVFTSAPAIKTSYGVKFVAIIDKQISKIGIKINGTMPAPNGVDVPMQSGNIGDQITALTKKMKIWPLTEEFMSSYKVPTFAVASKNDNVIRTSATKNFFEKLQISNDLFVLPRIKGVTHRSLIRSEQDLCLNIKEDCWQSLNLEEIMNRLNSFYEEHINR